VPPKTATAAPAKPSRWPLVVITILLLALGSVGTGWYLSANSQPVVDATGAVVVQKPIQPAPALYYALDPAFVVNLKPPELMSGSYLFDDARYLQVEVQLMTRDPVVHAALAQHAPALRARLLRLLGEQTSTDVADLESRERLEDKALAEVRSLIQAETGSAAVEALLFTSFVTQ